MLIARDIALFCALATLPPLVAQGTLADYQRASGIRKIYEAAARNIPETPRWLDSNSFWYRKSVKGGHEFVKVEAATGRKTPLFDHEKLAASLSKAAAASYTALTLPFNTVDFVDSGQALEMNAGDSRYRCALADYSCTKTGPATFPYRRGAPPPAARDRQAQPENRAIGSPDGKWEASIKNFNVYLAPKGKSDHERQLGGPRRHQAG